MDEILYKFKRNQLKSLIRSAGEKFREEPFFLEKYVDDQVKQWAVDEMRMDKAINCFEDLKTQNCVDACVMTR